LTKEGPDVVRAVVFCRTGRYDEAIKLLEPLRMGSLRGPAPLVTLYLVLAEHGRGHTAQAKQLLKETTDWLDKPCEDLLALPVIGASTLGFLGSPLGQGPLLAASALIPGRANYRNQKL
jgi:hypothetical protein